MANRHPQREFVWNTERRGSYRNDNIRVIHDPEPVNRDLLIKTFENDDHYEINKILPLFSTTDAIYNMFMYCINNNDEDFLDKLICKYDDYDFFGNTTLYILDFVNCKNNNITNKILSMKNINPIGLDSLATNAIHSDNMNIMNKLDDIGYKLSYSNLSTALFSGSCKYLDSILHLYDNLQETFDKCYRRHYYTKLSVEKIKHLISIGINITKCLNTMIISHISNNIKNNDTITYLYDLGGTNMNEAIIKSYIFNNVDLILYFFDKGATLNLKGDMHQGVTYETIKFLINHNYIFSNDIVEDIFLQMLKYRDIDQIEKFFDEFDNLSLDYLFEIEKNIIGGTNGHYHFQHWNISLNVVMLIK